MSEVAERETLLGKTSLKSKPRWVTAASFDSYVSRILDVWKGIFIFFMLTEHTRSSLRVSMTTQYPFMHFVSQVACALDMTTFATCYGFACYRSYLVSEVKNRPFTETISRALRSVGLIYGAALICNVTFATQVLHQEPTFKMFLEFATLRIIYWDFLLTFPFLLLMGALTTGPMLRFLKNANTLLKLCGFALLLYWPLQLANEGFRVIDCNTASGHYWSILFGCAKQTFTCTRFPAIPYMFFFNFGCILSFISLEISKWLSSGNESVDEASTSGSDTAEPRQRKFNWLPYTLFFSALISLEVYYAIPLFIHSNEPWEDYNARGYQRFPLNFRLALGWAFMSLLAGVCAVVATFCVPPLASLLEIFGANVLLYLTTNVIIIHGFFHEKWHADILDENDRKAWELKVVGVSVFTICATSLLAYLAKSSRK